MLDERLTLAVPCRFEGRVRYFLTRMEFSLEDGELVTDAHGRILCFASAEAARAFAARHFPEGEPVTDEEREVATLRRGLEEMYAPSVAQYQLDVADQWSLQPGGRRPDPRVLLESWRLLAWAGTAPEPARFDPMGFASRAPWPEEDAWVGTAMKLDGIVRERERRENRGESMDDQWSEYEDVWTDVDERRLAGILRAGLTAFAARLKDEP